MRILLLKTWITNIGNAFIDKGAKTCIKNAFPNAEIIEVSGFSNMTVMTSGTKFIARYIGEKIGKFGNLLINYGDNKMKKVTEKNNFVNIGEMIDADFAVLPGCVLDIYIEFYMKTLIKIREAGIPILLLGAGGHNYTYEKSQKVKSYFKRIEFSALLTRDSTAYRMYSNCFKDSYDGIDCGFFINDWYNPPQSKEPFAVNTFDTMREPKIDIDCKIIRAHHGTIISTYSGIIPAIGSILNLKTRVKRFDVLNENNFFVSDCLEDYLFLYSNAKEVHSDRVHACVASLAYGTPTKFYFKTPRAKLFDRIGAHKIYNQIVLPDNYDIENEKKLQVLALRNVVERFQS